MMTFEESNGALETLFTQQTKKKYGHVIGFDLGSSALCCSLSTDKNPVSASVFKEWINGSKKRSSYPACIQYKDWPASTNDIKVGFKGRPKVTALNDGDFYIPNIKGYVTRWIIEGANEDGPTADLVLFNFFEAVRANFDKVFVERNKDAVKPYSLDDCRFCFAVPDSLRGKFEYANLIRDAFKKTGFLKQDDDDNRLIFVSDAVAAGYNCLATPRIFSGIELEKNYLVADIGYEAAKFSLIKAQTTEAGSVVESVNSSEAKGYRSLSDNLRSYLVEKSETLGLDITNTRHLDQIIDSFEKYEKVKIDLKDDDEVTSFKGISGSVEVSNADLRETVFEPFLDGIFSLIYAQCEANSIKQIIFRGQYCEDPYFYFKCKEFTADATKMRKLKSVPTCTVWEEEPQFMVSNGAVSFGLRSVSTQIPTLVSQQISGVRERDTLPPTPSTPSTPTSENQKSNKALAQPTVIPKGHFAVGIDFGTTFSGCSFADISTVDPNNRREIIPVKKWDQAQPYPKISTALRYNEYKKEFTQYWGFDALDKRKKKGDINLEFFKLLLSPVNVERFYGKGNRDIQDIADRLFMFNVGPQSDRKNNHIKTLTPVDIIAEYLWNFNAKIREILNKRFKVSYKDMKLHYVLTVPAMWTETGRSTMIEAAIKAGLMKRGEEKTVQLITEPEAAALSCEEFMKHTFKLTDELYKEGLNFIVFDAGGGTVDLVTFRQQRVDGYDTIHQIGDGTGGTCGAVHLDRNFRELIERFYTHVMGVGDAEEEFYKHHMDLFKEEIKESFMPTNNPNRTFEIKLPRFPEIPIDAEPQESPGFDHNCRLTHDKKTFIVTEGDIQKFVFDPVIEQVLELLEKQIKKSAQFPLSAVLLVGGFSQSRYLQKRVKDYCKENNIPHVGIPPEGVTAISRGAVSYFLDPRLVSKKSATVSYAIQVDLPNRQGDKTHLAYFIRKGTPIEVEEMLYQQTVSVNYPESAVIALFSRDEKELPDQNDRIEAFQSNEQNDIKKVAEYVIDLPENQSIKNGTPVQLEISLKMTVEGVSLNIQSLNPLIKIEQCGLIDEAASILFERIQPEPLNIHLNAEKVHAFNIFSIFSSKK
ncbi:hypothetical protein [Parasitella parasitica]|uniref:Uncharacterized protein n=1 Tax=Parasitella parasitica TaxID=35722 RepID=A0A0B7MWS2_9FUNG|nr:hypothetical protein [Parasitella parasitica]